MELPFKYIVLSIIKKLRDRNIPLVIDKSKLVDYLTLLLRESFFSVEEKNEIVENFDFQYELDSLLTTYYQYFDIYENKIIFDDDYLDEIDILISREISEADRNIIYNIDCIVYKNTAFLEIIGVKIRKELYNYLLSIEQELEDCYNELSDLENYVGLAEVDTSNIIVKIKKLNIKKRIMLLNTKNLLPYIEQQDLMEYANNIADKTNELEEISLLLEDSEFSSTEIMYDVFLRSIFVSGDSYISNLREKLFINVNGIVDNIKYSTITFYIKFLELLEKEISISDETLNTELVRIKYRLMNVIDSVYDTTLFLNVNDSENNNIKKHYYFIEETIYYFIKELLMYDDDTYKNKEYDTDNIIIYLNNIIKKLLIETYYKLTNDKNIVTTIKENKLYGVNAISSSLLKDIVDKPKNKIKEK